jgi:hypothetical protein
VGDAIYFTKNDSVQAFTARLEQLYTAELAKPHPLRRVNQPSKGFSTD